MENATNLMIMVIMMIVKIMMIVIIVNPSPRIQDSCTKSLSVGGPLDLNV